MKFMTEQEITQHLVVKYQPHAIVLYGSRVNGTDVTPETDWDISVICNQPDKVTTELLGDTHLDVIGMGLGEQTILGGSGTPCLPMRVIYDDTLGLGQRIV